ncbi:MAG: insulinase family protein [Bacteroidales bacterium]|nr:insulinase family protein [Bacteroidales bacterium]
MKEGILSSGLRYAVLRRSGAAAFAALHISCGTRDEEPFHEGIAHFTEHTLFRGTKRHGASYIASCLDRLGGELNAYTTKEEIVLHATVLKEDVRRAAALLLELALEPSFPENEVETERGVVIDEIISYRDNPPEEIYDNFEGRLFPDHPLGRNILGSPESVAEISSEELRAFVSRHFTPENMVLTIVADHDEAELEKLISRVAASPLSALPAFIIPDFAAPKPLEAFSKECETGNNEVNVVLGGRAPSLYGGARRVAAALLAAILGGPAANSLLGRELREKHGWVYGVECSYTQYRDSGVMAVTFGCDAPNLKKCLRATARVISGMMERPMSEAALKAARRQALGQMAIASDSGEAQCLSMGKSMLSFGRVITPAETRDAVSAITPVDIQSVAVEIFSAPSLLIYR